jgi:hypothetical protein
VLTLTHAWAISGGIGLLPCHIPVRICCAYNPQTLFTVKFTAMLHAFRPSCAAHRPAGSRLQLSVPALAVRTSGSTSHVAPRTRINQTSSSQKGGRFAPAVAAAAAVTAQAVSSSTCSLARLSCLWDMRHQRRHTFLKATAYVERYRDPPAMVTATVLSRSQS